MMLMTSRLIAPTKSEQLRSIPPIVIAPQYGVNRALIYLQ